MITVETHKMTVMRPLREPIVAWCERCVADAPMVSPEKAANIMEVTSREIYRRIEQGALHFIETEDGSVLVCTNAASVGRT